MTLLCCFSCSITSHDFAVLIASSSGHIATELEESPDHINSCNVQMRLALSLRASDLIDSMCLFFIERI